MHHINKHKFKVPFVCGCRDLGEALRRIAEGASMIRTKGEAGTGNVVEAVRHCRAVQGAIRYARNLALSPALYLPTCVLSSSPLPPLVARILCASREVHLQHCSEVS